MSVQDEIFEWVSSFPPWKQDLFLGAAATTELTGAQIAGAVEQLLGEPGAGQPQLVQRADMPGGERSGRTLTLCSISGVAGVNALAEGQTLTFQPSGVSVIYGANGAGKTGYCRILKFAGRTLAPEDVHGNVLRASRRSARLAAIVDGEPIEIDIDFDGIASPELATMYVFDAKASQRYLVRDHAVDYVPLALRSVERLADALRAMVAELDRRIALVDLPSLDLSVFTGDTAVARTLRGLDDKTSDEQIASLAQLSEAEELHHAQLRRELAEIVSLNAGALRHAAQRRSEQIGGLRDELQTLATSLSMASLEAARQELRTLADAEQAAQLAATRFDGEPVPGVGTGAWRLMWSAAQDFAAQTPAHTLPPPPDHDPAHCPLCMQELDADARRRILSFDDFVRANVSARLALAQRAVTDRRDALPDLAAFANRHAEAITLVEDRCVDGDGMKGHGSEVPAAPCGPISAWLAAAESAARAIADGHVPETLAVGEPPLQAVGEAIDHFAAEAQRHASLERGEEQQRIRAELAELDARAALSKCLPAVMGRLKGLRAIARFETAKVKLSTAGVSSKLTQFAKGFIKADLEGALNRQLRALAFDGLEVQTTTRTDAGRPMVGLCFKTVDGADLCDVLSIGEQRRLSLAMFLAECEISGDESPVVLDDPTCSIDQEGRRHIARCIAKLAASRQVVVFTHELALINSLRSQAAYQRPAVEVHAQHVVRVRREAGHVRASLPWEGLSPSQRVGPLKAKLAAAQEAWVSGDPNIYAQHTVEYCNYLRQAFERTVETDVLNGAVTRGDDAVHTQQLSGILLTDDIQALIDRGMGESSPWVHDRSVYDNSGLPTLDEMREGLDCYLELLGTLKHMRVERERARERLRKIRVSEMKAADSGQLPNRSLATTSSARLRPRATTGDVEALSRGFHEDGGQLPLADELTSILEEPGASAPP